MNEVPQFEIMDFIALAEVAKGINQICDESKEEFKDEALKTAKKYLKEKIRITENGSGRSRKYTGEINKNELWQMEYSIMQLLMGDFPCDVNACLDSVGLLRTNLVKLEHHTGTLVRKFSIRGFGNGANAVSFDSLELINLDESIQRYQLNKISNEVTEFNESLREILSEYGQQRLEGVQIPEGLELDLMIANQCLREIAEPPFDRDSCKYAIKLNELVPSVKSNLASIEVRMGVLKSALKEHVNPKFVKGILSEMGFRGKGDYSIPYHNCYIVKLDSPELKI